MLPIWGVSSILMALAGSNNNMNNMKVAVIGSGGAGLATTRILQRNGIKSITVLEKGSDLGGVWSYKGKDSTKPMYKNLRTNLPREIMAFREKPWGNDGSKPSYVSHADVFSYLKDYTSDYELQTYISYNCQVNQLTVLDNDSDTEDEEKVSCSDTDASLVSPSLLRQHDGSSNDNEEVWPRIELQWYNSNKKEDITEVFDAVCVCNGHYESPYQATLTGIENFNGKVMHSIEYDDPTNPAYKDKIILCIGGRASGSDIAREISYNNKESKVYLSDSAFSEEFHGIPQALDNVIWLPRTLKYHDEKAAFEFDGGCDLNLTNVDIVIFCSGYDYSFPFINENSNLNELEALKGERRVKPLYKQLWYTKYPNLSFIGLQHSVIPFPLFELQAEAFVASLFFPFLPPYSTRLQSAREDASSGGPNRKEKGRVQDTHYLGGFQWDYCREMAVMSNLYNDTMEDYISTSKAIYDHSGNTRKHMFPGGPDTYRYDAYIRHDTNRSFRVISFDNKS